MWYFALLGVTHFSLGWGKDSWVVSVAETEEVLIRARRTFVMVLFQLGIISWTIYYWNPKQSMSSPRWPHSLFQKQT